MTRPTPALVALLVAMLAILLAGASPAMAQDVSPDGESVRETPRPGNIGQPAAPIGAKHLYDMADLLNPEQEANIEADATRLQRFSLPVVILVQINELASEDAAAFATEVRRQWTVESEPGADDGLVILISVNTAAGTVATTLSGGPNAFPNNGLTAEHAAEIESRWLNAGIADGQLYEGILFSLRRMIYHSIYDPAPQDPLTTLQQVVNVAVDIVGPILALGAISLAVLALRARHPRRAASAPLLVWGVPLAAMLIAIAAIWSRSGWGATTSLVLIAVTAILWVRRGTGRRAPRALGGTVTP